VQELLGLLQEAGHSDFRDARGPMGFTQRQANGKFTRDEAAAFIDQLQDDGDGAETLQRAAGVAAGVARTARATGDDRTLQRMPAERLAAELQRRGWVVMEP
jgi:hypothetical protein